MPIGDPFYGKCSFCGESLTAGHQCQPLFPRIAEEQQRGYIDLPRLSEEDIRRIIREELKRAFWVAHNINLED
jgi:hypothetical protein